MHKKLSFTLLVCLTSGCGAGPSHQEAETARPATVAAPVGGPSTVASAVVDSPPAKEEPLPIAQKDVKVDVSRLAGAESLVERLEAAGFVASIYDSPGDAAEVGVPEEHKAIWVGNRVASERVVTAMKIGREVWPFLEFVELSGDGGQEPPDSIHDEMYLGGATSTAKESKLRPWTAADFAGLDGRLPLSDLHRLIRSFYGPGSRPSGETWLPLSPRMTAVARSSRYGTSTAPAVHGSLLGVPR